MEITKRAPWLDLFTGLGSALVGYLVATILSIYGGLGALGPFGAVLLLAVGVLVAVGTYALLTPGDIPATKRAPWTNLINGLGSVLLGYLVAVASWIYLSGYTGFEPSGPLGSALLIGTGFVVAVGSHTLFTRL